MWQIDALPFIWSHRPGPSNAPLPDTLPFKVSEDQFTGRLIQVPLEEVTQALDLAYRSGSVITGAMSDSGLGKKYADDFLYAVLNEVLKNGRRYLRILEIGCGNGCFARELANMGHQVTGIDPGPQLVETESESLRLVRDFFPSERIADTFDLIIAYALLEHIAEPVAFLKSLLLNLSFDGTILFAVPDCEPPIALGDPSMLVHEHYSYFTASTIKRTVEQSGFAACSVRRAGFGGMLYASAVRSVSNQVTAMDSHTGGALHAYKSRVATNVQLLYQELVTAEIQNITIGIVVPGRMVNALAMLQSSTKKLRFFDDNPALHGTYYPPIAIPIEPTSSLISQPTDIVFVMTQTFGEQLANRLRASMGSHARILTMTELYEGSLAAAH